ncbi:hypothetical protein Pmar_PMAR026228 [Perkinsus marinus ATCC 50983]|uniref:EF-hand domain-containing protein n=1 Tax=Perkinsus marinus (strain ATCC 50983 / TXsc) TaxID=423536 RepID=C5KSD0_PERM5|nr:hypothetical protein Pmar_PMAR026228 [Perkinsus marinus ATCC 50983]EER12620.1 hypothetical protein Pmar_PMAR026228 [Perkinsus marinus ATCC 50983]|eukprot:XP_002780825.1 hypothetical protein Pmar_PMAR026228 [Perkinsus marinus ATCC 50983]
MLSYRFVISTAVLMAGVNCLKMMSIEKATVPLLAAEELDDSSADLWRSEGAFDDCDGALPYVYEKDEYFVRFSEPVANGYLTLEELRCPSTTQSPIGYIFPDGLEWFLMASTNSHEEHGKGGLYVIEPCRVYQIKNRATFTGSLIALFKSTSGNMTKLSHEGGAYLFPHIVEALCEMMENPVANNREVYLSKVLGREKMDVFKVAHDGYYAAFIIKHGRLRIKTLSCPGTGKFEEFEDDATPAPPISGVLEVRQTLHISPGLAGLATAFDKLPKDSDGVTREELQRLSPSTPAEIMDAIFGLFDNFPKDGKISYNELCAYLLLHAEGVTDAERSEFTFSICDANGDNGVSKEELAEVVGTLAYAKSKDWNVAKAVSLRIVEDAFAKSDEADLDIHAFTEWSRGQSEQAQEFHSLVTGTI